MVFFTDRDLGKLFPQILRNAGLNVERHDDYFSETTDDLVWLAEVARRGWFPITKNFRIRYQPAQRDTVMRAGAGLLVVIGQVPHQMLAENFVATFGKIDRFLKANRPPFIARIYRPAAELIQRGSRKSGRIELWLSFDEWRKQFGGH